MKSSIALLFCLAQCVTAFKDKTRAKSFSMIGGTKAGLGFVPTTDRAFWNTENTASSYRIQKWHVSREGYVTRDQWPANNKECVMLHDQEAAVQRLETRINSSARISTVEMLNRQDSQIWGTLLVGEPPVSMRVIFDTGSTNAWFMSTECTSSICNHGEPNKYDPDESIYSEKVKNGWSGNVDFATGSLYGRQYMDRVGVSKNLYVKRQSFNIIREMKGDMFVNVFQSFEGVVGFGFPEMSDDDTDPLLFSLLKEDVLEHASFSFYTNKHPGWPGYVNFGSPVGDSRLYEGQLQKFPVVEPYWWTLKLRRVLLGDDVFKTDHNLIVDSGTTFFAVPSYDIDSFLNAKNSDGTRASWTFEIYCNPPAEFYEDGPITKVQPTNWCDPENPNDYVAFTFEPEDYMVSETQPGVMPVTLPNGAHFFGQVAMKKFYTTFDLSDNTIGFAKSKENADLIELHNEALAFETAASSILPTEWEEKRSKRQSIAI